MSDQTAMSNSKDPVPAARPAARPAAPKGGTKGKSPKSPNVVWDDSNMKLRYANVVNATCTREEVNLFFGMNQAWSGAEVELKVNLTDRVVLNPFTAKRLMLLLTKLLQEYETRNGKLDIEVRDRSPSV